MKIGLFIICTNQYHQFLPRLIESADKYFFPEHEVVYLISSDNVEKIKAIAGKTKRGIIHKAIAHEPWPMPTLKRFEYFDKLLCSTDWAEFTNFFYIDVDAWFAAPVEKNILENNLIGVQHCGYVFNPGSFENRKEHIFYVDNSNHNKLYFGGGFFGGKAEAFKVMIEVLRPMIAQCINENKIPVWNDESALNWYFHNLPKYIAVRSLLPAYHYPEPTFGHVEHIFDEWKKRNVSYNPIIMLAYKGSNFQRT